MLSVLVGALLKMICFSLSTHHRFVGGTFTGRKARTEVCHSPLTITTITARATTAKCVRRLVFNAALPSSVQSVKQRENGTLLLIRSAMYLSWQAKKL